MTRDNTPVQKDLGFLTWNNNSEKKAALEQSAEALSEFRGFRAVASRFQDFSNIAPNISGRPEFTRDTYDYFRPSESVAVSFPKIIKQADRIYQRVGLVRNVIDLMGDFACQGVRLSHPVAKIERFYRRWFESVNGMDRSERFLNLLYRLGQVPVRKSTAKLSLGTTRKMQLATGIPDVDMPESYVPEKRELPVKYVFLDPCTIIVVGDALASFSGVKRYALNLPANLKQIILYPRSLEESQLVAKLPKEVVAAAKNNKPYPLDPTKMAVYFYKKDDWLPWAYPMIYAITDDIMAYEKTRLADIAALDGAISNIRLWKLGDIEKKIAPTKAAAAKLSQILQNNVGVGTLDLIWGEDLQLVESNTNVHQFLGEEKYKPHLNAIYAGLGIPPTLTGTYGAAGTTNNYISLRTLVERLQYGRNILISFWNEEVRQIQKSFGFSNPPVVEFDYMNLANEEAMLALYIQLADRNLISNEALNRMFKQPYNLEKVRLNKELKQRKSGRMVPQASAWHDPQIENSLKKIALQTGIVTPSEVGLELEEKKSGEKSALDKQAAIKKSQVKTPNTGIPSPGRPVNSKDSKKRKKKIFTPKARALLEMWADAAQRKVTEIMHPVFMEHYGKSNLRQLTEAETEETEIIKNGVIFNLEPHCMVDEITVTEALKKPMPAKAQEMSEHWALELEKKLLRKPTFDELRTLNNSVYASYQEIK